MFTINKSALLTAVAALGFAVTAQAATLSLDYSGRYVQGTIVPLKTHFQTQFPNQNLAGATLRRVTVQARNYREQGSISLVLGREATAPKPVLAHAGAKMSRIVFEPVGFVDQSTWNLSIDSGVVELGVVTIEYVAGAVRQPQVIQQPRTAPRTGSYYSGVPHTDSYYHVPSYGHTTRRETHYYNDPYPHQHHNHNHHNGHVDRTWEQPRHHGRTERQLERIENRLERREDRIENRIDDLRERRQELREMRREAEGPRRERIEERIDNVRERIHENRERLERVEERRERIEERLGHNNNNNDHGPRHDGGNDHGRGNRGGRH